MALAARLFADTRILRDINQRHGGLYGYAAISSRRMKYVMPSVRRTVT